MTMLKQRLFQSVPPWEIPVSVVEVEAKGIHRHQGHIGAALVLGGVDVTGPQLFTVAPHGSTDKLPYVTMGSGSLAAMAVFESSWRAGLDVRPSHQLSQNRNTIIWYY